MPKPVVKIPFAKRSSLNPDSKPKDIQVNPDPDPIKETRKVTNASGKQFDVPILVTSGYDLDNMKCTLCDKSFKLDRYLMEHLLIRHFGTMPKMATCPVCDKSVNRKSFVRHLRLLHGIENKNIDESDKKPKKTCPICSKKVHRNSFSRHLKYCREKNLSESEIRHLDAEHIRKSTNCKCDMCDKMKKTCPVCDKKLHRKSLTRHLKACQELDKKVNVSEITNHDDLTKISDGDKCDNGDEVTIGYNPRLRRWVTKQSKSINDKWDKTDKLVSHYVTSLEQSVTSDDEDETLSQSVTLSEQSVTSDNEDDAMSQHVTSSKQSVTSDNEDDTLSLRIEDLRSVTWDNESALPKQNDELIESPNPEVQIPFATKSNPESNQSEVNSKQCNEFQKCLFCNYNYFNRLDLVRHFVDNHCRASQFYDDQIQQPKCSSCDMSHTSQLSRLRHQFSTHIDVTYINDELKVWVFTLISIMPCFISHPCTVVSEREHVI